MTPPTETHGQSPHDGHPGDNGPSAGMSDALHNEDVAHEHSDVNVRAVLVFIVVLSLVCLVAGAAMLGVFHVLEGQAAKEDPILSPLATPAGQQPPEPRLLTNEPANLEKQRAKERDVLDAGEWVDRNAGVGRIPIADAKKVLLHKGLPTRAGAPVDPRLGTRAPSMSDASSGRNAAVKSPAPTLPAGQQPEVPKTDAPKTGHKPGGER